MGITLLAILVAALPVLAFAGDTPDWTVDMGATDVDGPAFPGSKIQRNSPLPAVSISYKDLFFVSFQDGVGVNILRSNGLTVGPLITFEPARSYADDRLALRGLPDVPFTIAAGGFINYDFGVYASLKGELSKSVNGNHGLATDIELAFRAPPLLSDRLFLSAGPKFQFYDGHYARAYFGVSKLSAEQSLYPVFVPHSGLASGLSADAEYLITDKVSLNIFGTSSQYGGGITNSPILRGKYGTREQDMLGMALTYRFAF